jgi:predicted DNA-binding transcriptional regulator YafY
VRTLERGQELKRPARLSYRSASELTKERLVEPVDLRSHGEHLYVVTWDVAKKAWRTFKADRILDAALVAEGVCSHPPYDPEEVFANSVGIWSAESVVVRVRVTPEKAMLLREYPLGPKPTVTEGADGSALVEARVAGLVEAKAWVIRWGRHAEVIAPQQLRELVREEHEAAASLCRRSKRKRSRR